MKHFIAVAVLVLVAFSTAESQATNCVNNKPCANGGSCDDSTSTKKCVCLNGYTDDNCETAPTACNGNTCSNHGICKLDSDDTTAVCQCNSGFGGADCSEADKCDGSKICKYGGNCTGSPKECTCLKGYTGDLCDTVPTKCNGKTCKNGGTCKLDSNNKAVCACASGYGGENCETASTTSAPTHSTTPSSAVAVSCATFGLIASLFVTMLC